MREKLAPWGQIGSHQSKGNISRVQGPLSCCECRRKYFIFAYHPLTRRCTRLEVCWSVGPSADTEPSESKSATFNTIGPLAQTAEYIRLTV